MSRLLRFAALILLTAPLCLAAGCKQGAGERCQVQSDCDDGLLCILPAGGSAQSGGTCQPAGGTTGDMSASGVDMAMTTPPGDMAMTGGGTD